MNEEDERKHYIGKDETKVSWWTAFLFAVTIHLLHLTDVEQVVSDQAFDRQEWRMRKEMKGDREL